MAETLGLAVSIAGVASIMKAKRKHHAAPATVPSAVRLPGTKQTLKAEEPSGNLRLRPRKRHRAQPGVHKDHDARVEREEQQQDPPPDPPEARRGRSVDWTPESGSERASPQEGSSADTTHIPPVADADAAAGPGPSSHGPPADATAPAPTDLGPVAVAAAAAAAGSAAAATGAPGAASGPAAGPAGNSGAYGAGAGAGAAAAASDPPSAASTGELILSLNTAAKCFTGREAILAAFPDQVVQGGGTGSLFVRTGPAGSGGPSGGLAECRVTIKVYTTALQLGSVAPLVALLGLKPRDRLRLSLQGPDRRAVVDAVEREDLACMRLTPHRLTSLDVNMPIVVHLLGEEAALSPPGSRSFPVHEEGRGPGESPGLGLGLGLQVGELRSSLQRASNMTRWYIAGISGWLLSHNFAEGNYLRFSVVRGAGGVAAGAAATALPGSVIALTVRVMRRDGQPEARVREVRGLSPPAVPSATGLGSGPGSGDGSEAAAAPASAPAAPAGGAGAGARARAGCGERSLAPSSEGARHAEEEEEEGLAEGDEESDDDGNREDSVMGSTRGNRSCSSSGGGSGEDDSEGESTSEDGMDVAAAGAGTRMEAETEAAETQELAASGAAVADRPGGESAGDATDTTATDKSQQQLQQQPQPQLPQLQRPPEQPQLQQPQVQRPQRPVPRVVVLQQTARGMRLSGSAEQLQLMLPPEQVTGPEDAWLNRSVQVFIRAAGAADGAAAEGSPPGLECHTLTLTFNNGSGYLILGKVLYGKLGLRPGELGAARLVRLADGSGVLLEVGDGQGQAEQQQQPQPQQQPQQQQPQQQPQPQPQPQQQKQQQKQPAAAGGQLRTRRGGADGKRKKQKREQEGQQQEQDEQEEEEEEERASCPKHSAKRRRYLDHRITLAREWEVLYAEKEKLEEVKRTLEEGRRALAEERRRREGELRTWEAERRQWLAEKSTWEAERRQRAAERRIWEAERRVWEAERRQRADWEKWHRERSRLAQAGGSARAALPDRDASGAIRRVDAASGCPGGNGGEGAGELQAEQLSVFTEQRQGEPQLRPLVQESQGHPAGGPSPAPVASLTPAPGPASAAATPSPPPASSMSVRLPDTDTVPGTPLPRLSATAEAEPSSVCRETAPAATGGANTDSPGFSGAGAPHEGPKVPAGATSTSTAALNGSTSAPGGPSNAPPTRGSPGPGGATNVAAPGPAAGPREAGRMADQSDHSETTAVLTPPLSGGIPVPGPSALPALAVGGVGGPEGGVVGVVGEATKATGVPAAPPEAADRQPRMRLPGLKALLPFGISGRFGAHKLRQGPEAVEKAMVATPAAPVAGVKQA